MRDVAADRNATRAENVRYGAVAIALSVTFYFLLFARERGAWSWRLLAFGAIVGPLAYSFSLGFRLLARSLVSRNKRVVANVLMAPLDFAGGCLAFAIVHRVFPLALLNAGDARLLMLVSGLMTAEVGVLFYLFHRTNKRLMRSVRRISEQEFAERELELARSIQQRLLPPERVEGDGYEVRSRNLAAHYVAGDFYDVFRLGDGTVGIAVADVSGKGIGASLIMATVKAILPLVAEGRNPPAVLSELTSRLHGELPAREFVALAYAQYDPVSGLLELANAGLPDPYLLRNGKPAEILSVPGPRLPLAIRRHVPYESVVVTLEPGDSVLLLTDGLPEATVGEEPLGYDALLALIDELAREHDHVLDPLFAAVHERSAEKREDDWTVLILRAGRERPLARSAPMDAENRRRLVSREQRSLP